MAFHDVRFPDRIAEGAEGGPEFSTSVIVSSGGHEQRQGNWSAGRGRWNVATGLQDDNDLAVLIAFFRARAGRLHAFRFKDWSDYQLDRQVIGTTGGGDATWQILRTYTSGPTSVTRTITRPVAGTVRCWVNGTERSLGTGSSQFQVNLATGVITLGSALAGTTGQAIEAACEFDVPARFDTDTLPLRLTAFQIGEWSDIPVVEIRE
ncbi:DUF2460 domain-containing protein [Roseomonas alkaliterrae]|uniref:Uncharacterized protein (TIGR02217 family) n=1 Tax=Neoroseomonas alkaliterrae TaxID=1452450 RepID=A0A840XV55_9PROT|nr:DUF2460 domain-containing protein [Neoroseomonas alkaliterrae]MBB5691776.1 uncharacterized protein (TIGR02217 family) [Neoroseomonas alkaliterrae]MBR0676102.1 DUF2460 domain-containing protein [Neoroseomonas alkaliterrae]